MTDADNPQTPKTPPVFDFDAYPPDTLFYDRRSGKDRRAGRQAPVGVERRAKKDRRRRVDPTTYEKQYSPAEVEFMSAMQDFKLRSGKPFPSHGEVLAVARALGYRKVRPAGPLPGSRLQVTKDIEGDAG